MVHEIEILLVEDSASDAEMTLNALELHGFINKILHVKDGVAALDYLFAEGKYAQRQIENTPRLILLDLKMPKVSGVEVLEKIRADSRTRRIPVVILTSSKEDPDIQKCYDLGANSYVVKPVDFQEFQKAISDLGLYWMMINQQPNK